MQNISVLAKSMKDIASIITHFDFLSSPIVLYTLDVQKSISWSLYKRGYMWHLCSNNGMPWLTLVHRKHYHKLHH